MYGEGISKTGELIDLGVAAGVVEKSGAWFSYDGQRIGQGRENAKTFLKENPAIAAAIEKRHPPERRHRRRRDDGRRRRQGSQRRRMISQAGRAGRPRAALPGSGGERQAVS